MGEEYSDSGSEKSPDNSRPSSPKSGSGSRSSRSRSRSSRSNSGSNRSHSGSNRSRSGSNHSGSASNRSRSGSNQSNRSRSGSNQSRGSAKSGNSRRSRSGSKNSIASPSSRKSSVSSNRSNGTGRNTSKSPSPQPQAAAGTPQSTKSRSVSQESDAIGKKKRRIISDSDSNDVGGEKISPQKRSKLIDTDSDEDQNETQKEDNKNASALFGDADDISTDDEAKSNASDKEVGRRKRSVSETSSRHSRRSSKSGSIARSRSRSGSKSSRDENKESQVEEREKTPIPETKIDVEIPRIHSDLGKDIHFVKLPNFLSVDTRPFDQDTYEDEIDEEETLDEEGRQRLKLKVGNTIRWRKYIDDKGETVQESNARFVRWSDGSLSLHLGAEIFDVYKQPLQSDYNHLYIRQGTGLQGQAVFRTKLTFRPHSTDSFTHKKMTMSLADRSQKTSGIKILSQVGHDPEAERAENLKKEEESLRQLMRQRKPVKSAKRTKRSSQGLNTSGFGDHEDESGDEGGISIAAIKNKYKKNNMDNKPIYSSDDDASDGSDFDTRRKKTDKAKPAKALKDSDDESHNEEDADAGSGKESQDEEGSGSGSASHSDEDD